MKKLMVIAVALLAGMTIATAQTKEVKKETKPTVKKSLVAQSTLEWIKTDIDLGDVVYRKPATATYEFVNKGEKPVIITNVRTSCGCTKKSQPKEPIKPGEKSQVQATYNAARVGKFVKTITVTTNEGAAPKILKIRGNVVKPATAETAK